MKAVDCHCHLDFDRFDSDRSEVVERIRNNLEFAVSVGCNEERNEKTLRIAEEHDDVLKYNLGLHPTYTDDFSRVEEIKQQIRSNNPCAVGEIGLDHYHVTDEKVQRRQEQVFRELLELAEELCLPVNVHSRSAEQRTIDILKEYNLPDVLIHCFNGSVSEAEEAVENGFTIGVTTQVLYSSHVKDLVKALDLSSIVLETDSPFLYREGRNEPVNVLESAEKVADLKEVSVEKVLEVTRSNSLRIFGEHK